MAKQVDSTNIGTLLEALITKIKSFFWRKDETSQLPIDNTPTSGSNNLVKSGGVYSSLQGIRQLKVLNLGNFYPSSGSHTLGTKSEAAATLNITEAQLDLLCGGEYDCIEFSGYGGSKIQTMAPFMSAYMCIGANAHYVMMPFILALGQFDDNVYSYDYSPIGIKDVTVGGESVATDATGGIAVIPAIPDVSQFITRSVNDLVNYYLKSETYTQTEVNNLIGAIQQFHYEIAASTSAVTDPSNNVLYLIGPTGSGADKYEEYVYSSGWVKIGDTSIDLSGYVTTQALNTALSAYTTTNDLTTLLAGKQDTIDAQHKLDYSLIANTPTIPPADYVAMIDITSSVDGSGNVNVSAAIVSGTFAEIDAALLAQKTVLLIGRYPKSTVSYQYFRCGEHRPAAEIVFTSTGGGEWFRGLVTAATWYPAANGEPERVLVEDATGILGFSPTGDGNAVTSIEKNPLLPLAVVNKDKTFVDTAQQTLTDAQKSQARTNIGAGTYSKPANGIPASDLANGVIPTVPTDIVKYTAQTLTDAQKTQARTNIGATAPEVFWAEYGVTTVAEINAQVSAGKAVFLLYQNQQLFGIPQIYSLFTSAPASVMFYSFFAGGMFMITADVSGSTTTWNEPTSSWLEVADDKVTSWQTTPDNTHYPSEKLVKDSLDGKQPTIDAQHKLDYSLLSNTPTVPTQYAGSPTAGGFANKAVAIPFGSVDSDSTATDIKATVDNFPTTLTDGVCAYIRNDVVASAGGFTLNINGTGAKPVYQTLADASRVSTVFNANSTYLFIYNSTRVDGGCWDLYYGYNSNDNTIGYNLRTNGASAPPAAQKYYRYHLLFTAANGQSLVPANTSSSTSATAAKAVNQAKIDPFGVIFYYSHTSAVNAAASPNASYLWMQYNGIALGYSFNRTGAALEMTARDPVYLKCAPQSDGSAIMDADNPIVQALPSAADGKIYIFLGFAESATALTLYYWHPVYYHDGTKICAWTGMTTNSGGTETDEYLSKNLTFEVLSPGTIEWRTTAFSPSSAKKINYRINNGVWVESVAPSSLSSVTNTDAIIFVSQGDIVEISGVGTNPTGGAFPTFFAGTARFKAYGNIMSLIGGDDFVGLKTITVYRAFANLFADCVGLVDASNLRLPATTLSSNCYEQMFMGCTSLTMPPMMLPATTLNISCYSSMFKNCTALTNVPVILATTLEMRCCDSMFYGCTSITASPSLRVISLANYCFENMFYGCTSLNYVIALFTDTPGSNYTNNWLYGVSATGTFVKNSSATWDVSGSSGIPSGWTVETTSR